MHARRPWICELGADDDAAALAPSVPFQKIVCICMSIVTSDRTTHAPGTDRQTDRQTDRHDLIE